MIILLTVLEFFSGSLMFSYWLGLVKKKDIRTIGDGNPGAFNLMQTSGLKLGVLGVFLDFMKGYFPLVVFIGTGHIKGFQIIPLAIAPILGHIFSPFMKFNGGKGLAVTFGVWSALTKFQISFLLVFVVEILHIITTFYTNKIPLIGKMEQVRVIFGMTLILIYMLVMKFPDYIILLWILNLFILAYKNKNNVYTFIKSISGKNI